MKILKIHYVIKDKTLVNSQEYKHLLQEVYKAIRSIKWPPRSRTFTLNPTKQGNGIKPHQRRISTIPPSARLAN